MRAFLSVFFIVVALGSGYLFATGATYPPWEWGSAEFLERVLAPFQLFSFFSGFLVLTAVVAFLASLLCFECEGRNIADGGARRAWAKVLEIGFIVNIVLVAAVLTVLGIAGSGLASGFQPTTETLGCIFASGLLEALLGTVLACVLFFVQQRRSLYYSTLAAHLAEVVLLGTVFFLGSAA